MKNLILFLGISMSSLSVFAEQVTIPMSLTNESASQVGYITAKDTKYGVLFTAHLSGLVPSIGPGVHGFHVHENPSCANGGMAAGGHLDPKKAKHHLGPYNPDGHLGDLPALYVNSDGTIAVPVLAPRIKVKDILGHSLMIHNGGDNYSDDPEPLGGGGKRMVCGIIPVKADK